MAISIFQALIHNLPRPTPTAALDILLVAYLIYQLLLVVRGTRAAHILLGLSLVGLLYYVSRIAGLETLHSIMANLIPYSVLAIIVLIRTFLSFELELEIEGRWPWQREASRAGATGSDRPVAVRSPRPRAAG